MPTNELLAEVEQLKKENKRLNEQLAEWMNGFADAYLAKEQTDKNYLAAVKGRKDFREAYKEMRSQLASAQEREAVATAVLRRISDCGQKELCMDCNDALDEYLKTSTPTPYVAVRREDLKTVLGHGMGFITKSEADALNRLRDTLKET